VREQLRLEIRRLQKSMGITTLFVTHDQHEAMAIADRIGVVQHGSLVQLGAPADVYTRPGTAFVSAFLGTSNRLPVHRSHHEARVLGAVVPDLRPGVTEVFVRPEHIRVVDPLDSSVEVTVVDRSFLGALTRIEGRLEDRPLVIDLPSRDAQLISVGDTVNVTLDGPVVETGEEAWP